MTERFRVGAFEPVYDPSFGEPERWYINDHTFVRDHRGTWHLIGITHAEPAAPFDELHFAHATAATLHGPWTKQPFALSTDHAWGETHLWAPHVVEHESTYWMYYCAGGAEKAEYRIHLATSDDCVRWTRHPANPMVVDGFEARDPMVLWVDDRWVLYYTATGEPTGGAFIVAAAESDDLVHWSGRHTVYRDELTGTGAGPTESPFVVAHDGTYYLLIGPDWQRLVASYERTGRYDPAAYRRTRVLASHDPLRFDLDGLVTVVDAHAAEVIVDEVGDRWLSHCGWGQRGVSLAPLTIGAESGKTSRVATLRDVQTIARGDSSLAIVSTLRADGTIQSSLVNAGVMKHPLTGAEVVAFVTYGRAKLSNLRARPQLNVAFRSGWQWVAVEGRAEIIGPDDPHPEIDDDRLRTMLRDVFSAAGGTHDDWDEYDRVMARERRAAVFVTPTRVYSNAGR